MLHVGYRPLACGGPCYPQPARASSSNPANPNPDPDPNPNPNPANPTLTLTLTLTPTLALTLTLTRLARRALLQLPCVARAAAGAPPLLGHLLRL